MILANKNIKKWLLLNPLPADSNSEKIHQTQKIQPKLDFMNI
jgi:hypothetical protein